MIFHSFNLHSKVLKYVLLFQKLMADVSDYCWKFKRLFIKWQFYAILHSQHVTSCYSPEKQNNIVNNLPFQLDHVATGLPSGFPSPEFQPGENSTHFWFFFCFSLQTPTREKPQTQRWASGHPSASQEYTSNSAPCGSGSHTLWWTNSLLLKMAQSK